MASSSSPKPKKGRDFYAILGIERTANQGQIKHAYRKLAMQNHPDKNPGNEEAAEKFKEVSTAYAVLSDPNKKRQYDLHGEDGSVSEIGAINVENLGTVGRLFGALISKAGIPVPTEITQKVLSSAQYISQGRTDVKGLPTVTDVSWGQTITASVGLQSANFYRITVTEQDLSTGVIISCTSTDNDKFKIVFFDSNGSVTMVEESQKRKKYSEANLFVVPYGRYNLMEMMPLAMMRRVEDDVPPVFMILDTYDMDVKSLLPGTHLFCIYGDNWLQSVNYSLRCLQAIPPSSDCVVGIRATEEKLANKKRDLENFQGEFCEIKKKYEEACKKLEADIKETVELVQEREKSYNDYVAQSSQKYAAIPGKNTSPKSGGLFGLFS